MYGVPAIQSVWMPPPLPEGMESVSPVPDVKESLIVRVCQEIRQRLKKIAGGAWLY